MGKSDLKDRSVVYLILIAVFFSVIVLVLTGRYINAQKESYRRQVDEFYNMASTGIRAIEHSITTKINSIYVMQDAIRIYGEELTLEKFTPLAERIMRRTNGIYALEWAPEIRRNERERYEQKARNEGLAGFTIRDIDKNGKMIVASERDVYFPIYYIAPMEGNEMLLGYDAQSNPGHARYMEKAIESREIVVSTRVELIEARGHYDGVIVLLTESDPMDINKSDNLLAVVFKINELVASTLSNSLKHNLQIHVYDIQNQDDKYPLYSLNGRADAKGDNELHSLKRRESLNQVVELSVGDRQWAVYISPRETIVPPGNSILIWLMTLAGLSTAFYFVFFIFYRTRRSSKKIESHLYNLNLQYQAIVENTLDGIVTVSQSGIIQSFNMSAEKIFGYRPDEMIGEDINRLIKDFVLSFSSPGGDIVRSEQEVCGMTRSGKTIPLRVGVTGVKTEQQHLYIAILQDISEKKRIENMKDQFMSTVNHELRTPLTSIYGGLQLLEKLHIDSLNESARKLLSIVLSNTNRIILLVNDILDVQRIELDEIQLNTSNLDLCPIISDAVRDIRIFAHENGVNINTALPNQKVMVSGDEGRLLQVMNNLLSNAIKFSASGSSVEVLLKANEKEKSVCVKIVDQGVGISDAFKDKLFQRFAREDNSATRKTQGTGLGLSICKAIVEQHHGTIGASSKKGMGSTFFFELPLSDVSK